MSSLQQNMPEGVAIIGMAGRFPGAMSVRHFWENICNGIESIHDLSDDELRRAGVDDALIADPDYVKRCGLCKDTDLFDAGFFGINAREAETMDPQHRVLLECAWEALEHAGYDPDRIGTQVGVYAGCGMNRYLVNNLAANPEVARTVGDYQMMIGNASDYLTTRISYKLNLHGPSVTLLTACSTSLVAIHTACQSLLTWQCDMALAGGVSLKIPHETGYLFRKGHILSPDGHCRAFDEKAGGTVWSEGAGLVVLKRLNEAIADRDTIYAIIKSTAINNDGAGKVGYTAPGVEGQAQVIALAHALADVRPRDISYVEAHGTGTPLGDPIEITALHRAFAAGNTKEKYCAIGSVKTNIGHLDAAAGVAGIIKTALALRHRVIPPSLHFTKPNPELDLENKPFFVNTTLQPWETTALPRRAGVSSFGIGGTNAHAVLEEPPLGAVSLPSTVKWHLLALSARSKTALDAATKNMEEALSCGAVPDMADIAYTLTKGRKVFSHRRVIVGNRHDDAATAITTGDTSRIACGCAPGNPAKAVFMFSGQSSQYAGMARQLYDDEPIFREIFERCCMVASPLLGEDLRGIIFDTDATRPSGAEPLSQTLYTQPALFTVEYSLARLLMERGVQPMAMIGHSIGEYVAACLAGVFNINDALRVIVRRARLMQERPAGVMLSVSAPREQFEEFLGSEIEIALVNAPQLYVVGGPPEPMANLEKFLAGKNILYRRLHTSHAFHTAAMDGACTEFGRAFDDVTLGKPTIPFISNVSGTWITEEQAASPDYWVAHIRSTVRFSEGVYELLRSVNNPVFIECGPGNTLCTLVGLHKGKESGVVAVPTVRHQKQERHDGEVFHLALGHLWACGVPIDLGARYADEKRYRVALPTYPFERERYWVEPAGSSATRTKGIQPTESVPVKNSKEELPGGTSGLHERPQLANAFAAPETDREKWLAGLWQRFLGIAPIGRNDDFFELGGHSLLAVQLFSDIFRECGVNLPLATLFSAPKLRQLAEAIEAAHPQQLPAIKTAAAEQPPHRQKNPWSFVVPIKPEGGRTPFFCIHGVGGNVLHYYQMVKHLDNEQPLYGVQCRGLDGISKPFASVEEMAAAYIAEIRQIQPKGPYIFGGDSMGGLVAFEMAQQLIEAGETIKKLIMIDSVCLNGCGPVGDRQQPSPAEHAKKIMAVPGKLVHSIRCRLRDTARLTYCKWFVVRGVPIPHEHRYWMVDQKNIAISERYTPRPIKERITFLRALNNIECSDPYRGWRRVAMSGFEFFDFLCSHENTIEHEPLLEKLGEVLRLS